MQLAMIGVGRMGANMVRRLVRAGHSCVVFDRSQEAVSALVADGADGAASMDEVVRKLARRRVIWMMVPAATVDRTVRELAPLLDEGDVVVDGGNSNYVDDQRRARELAAKGVQYVDVGTSGGVWGLERGYCLMIGGDEDPVHHLDPIFASLAPGPGSAPRTEGRERPGGTAERGYLHCGPAGSGHFVKMVHNGIEYGLMAAYAEGLNVLRHANVGRSDGRVDAFLEPLWNRSFVESVEITMAEAFGVEGRGSFYDQTGAIRDVVQNHLLQILANLAMEPPPGPASGAPDPEALRDEKVKVLRGVPALEPRDVVRGQFRGYRNERGVASGSTVETFVALRLEINSWRWKGVPFYVRAGKCLPVIRTEVLVRLQRPPTLYTSLVPPANHFRFTLSPEATIAIGAAVKAPGAEPALEEVELVASHEEAPEELTPYEQLLGDAMRGEPFRFAREDYVEEAWRIVEPVLRPDLPVHEYEPGTWGPAEADALVHGGWHAPAPT